MANHEIKETSNDKKGHQGKSINNYVQWVVEKYHRVSVEELPMIMVLARWTIR